MKQYLEICASYTDIQKDGQDLIKEMKIKTKQKEAFLDGAKTNLADQNNRSQHTNQSWLDVETHGLKA